MKKILTLVSLLFVTFVAGAQTPATRLESLPIGNPEVVSNVVVRYITDVGIQFVETTNSPVPGQRWATGTEIPYNFEKDGDLTTFMRESLKKYSEKSINSDLLFSDKYRVFERRFVSKFQAGAWPEGGMIWSLSKEFSFILGEDGKLKMPEEAWNLPVNVFQTYEPIRVSGVRWVEVTAWSSNGETNPAYYMEGQSFYYTSRNGSYNCPELEKLWGNGRIYLPARLMTGEDQKKWPELIRGWVTLYYDEEKTDYDKFDWKDGSLLERVIKNPPQFSSPKITISPLGEGVVEIGVEGLGDNSAIIEYQQEDGEWKPLSSPLRGASAGKVSLRDTANAGMRFYRARIVQNSGE